MEEQSWGVRDKQGEWKPDPLPEPGPVFSLPWNLKKVLTYLFAPEGFLWPFNLLYALMAVAVWRWFTPGLDQTAAFAAGWVAQIYLRNVILLMIVAGGLHLRLYIVKGQGTRFKYTDRWLAKDNRSFLFRNQTLDNVLWNLTSGAMIWTAWEAVTLWLYANNHIPFISFAEYPVYAVLLMVGVILLRMVHFYWVHRFIHWKPMFKACHYLHHKNINIGPWSGLSMHPLEHLLYFSGALFHWIIPSHPIHVIFHLLHAGVSPALGHAGFHKLVTREERGLMSDNYFHYLHHKYFTVNFGHESVPLDKWFGSFHDGSEVAHQAMLARRREQRETEI